MKERITEAIVLFVGIVGGIIGTKRYMGKKMNIVKQHSEKHLDLFLMMNQWVKIKQEGRNLSSYLKEKGYKRVAIYGMSYAGETLLEELRGTEIQVVYGIDKNAENVYSTIDILTLDDSLEEVDAIIVTAITFFDEIEEKLCEKTNSLIISLKDILYEI